MCIDFFAVIVLKNKTAEFLKKRNMRMSEKKHIILTNMNTKLWNRFKGVCYTNGEAMNRVVSHLITTYIDENK